MILDIVKTLLGITDTSQDALISTIVTLTESRLSNLLGGVDAVPEALGYIVTEVTIRRFNRIGSEGLASHTVEGETMTWPDDDFKPFMDDIQAWLDENQDDAKTKRGRVRFI